ncbi:MAG: SGNH/GDSL hydrolase family protein [Bryobacteraceae bacterium]
MLGKFINIQNVKKIIEKDNENRIEKFKVEKCNNVKGLHLLAIGDSWFDYPPYASIPGQVPNYCNPKPTILNLAHAGDPTTVELGITKTKRIIDAIDKCNGNFDGILFSGGGDDVCGEMFNIWLNNASDVNSDDSQGINQTRFNSILSVIQSSYQDLIQLRNKYLPGKPIFTHCYDFAFPSGLGICGCGPWLLPGLVYRGWTDFDAGARIVKAMLIQLFNMVQTLSNDSNNNLINVPTQNTLVRSQWSNELHPTYQGFGVISSIFVDSLRKYFPGKI